LLVELLPLESGQPLQLHFEYRLGLRLCELEPRHQALAGFRGSLGLANQRNDRIQVVQRFLESFQYMGAGFGFPELVASSPGHYFAAMIDEQVQRLDQIQLFGLPIDDGQVYHTERLLHRCQFVQVVQHDIGNGVSFQLDHDPHAFAVRFVAQIRNAFDLFVVDKLGDSFDQLGLVDLVGNFGHDDRHSLAGFPDAIDGRSRTHDDRAPALLIGLPDALLAIYETAGWKI